MKVGYSAIETHLQNVFAWLISQVSDSAIAKIKGNSLQTVVQEKRRYEMEEIKVLLASRPKLLSEVIRNMIDRQSDMEVDSEVLDPIELLLAVKITKADVVIITPLEANGEPHICSQLLAEYPQLKIVTQSAKGSGSCHEFEFYRWCSN